MTRKTRLGGTTVAKEVRASSATVDALMATSATITALAATVTGNVTGNTTGTHTGNVVHNVQVASADAAITITSGIVMIVKGSAAALTLAAPAAGDAGKHVLIYSTTAFAHTVTQTTPGFNGGGGASDLATFGAAAGNCFEIVAYDAKWWVVRALNVTLS